MQNVTINTNCRHQSIRSTRSVMQINGNKANGVNLGSAHEHLFDDDLTDDQRLWLRDFCARWEAAEEAHRESRL
jgi:hypothetical protein